MNYPNQRGNALRDREKNIRLQTHFRSLELVKNLVHPAFGIEHGMGHHSTSWFHSLGLQKIISVENDPRWRICNNCAGNHEIFGYETIDQFREKIVNENVNYKSTIALVDGPGPERIDVFLTLLSLGVKGIVMHDAEVITPEEIEQIRISVAFAGYFVWQHITENPETLVCYDEDLKLSDGYIEF